MYFSSILLKSDSEYNIIAFVMCMYGVIVGIGLGMRGWLVTLFVVFGVMHLWLGGEVETETSHGIENMYRECRLSQHSNSAM